jgi:hypothetical protein
MFVNFVSGFRGLISISGFSVTIDFSVILISFGTVENFWNDRYCSGKADSNPVIEIQNGRVRQ